MLVNPAKVGFDVFLGFGEAEEELAVAISGRRNAVVEHVGRKLPRELDQGDLVIGTDRIGIRRRRRQEIDLEILVDVGFKPAPRKIAGFVLGDGDLHIGFRICAVVDLSGAEQKAPPEIMVKSTPGRGQC